MANQFLGLSLFIVLLSFFIILNGISDYEDSKAQSVVNSIATAFSDRQAQANFQPNIVPSDVESIKEGDTLDKIQGVFNTHITGIDIKKNRLGTVMHVRMAVPKLERAILTPIAATAGTPDRGFLPMLVSLMQTREGEKPYRMDMVFNTKTPPAAILDETPSAMKNQISKIAALSIALEGAGLEKKLISIGMDKGQPGFVDLYFRRYHPFSPVENQGAL